ncbi:MAG: helix-turn-helix transcriptional regulator [Proteobacteria bacterium]|nr:helix-turn-helix transcriptional regulator [Pseudomonadota bacterium]
MIKKIRQELGLSQELTAGYLGISRSHLAMVEASRRALSSTAYTRLMELYMQLTAGKKAPPPPAMVKESGAALRKEVEANRSQREYQLAAARAALRKLEQQHQQAAGMLAKLEELKRKGSFKDPALLGIIEDNAKKAFRESAADIRLKTQLKIKALEAELKFLKGNIKM